MSLRLLAAAGAIALLLAGGASAQEGPESVGLPSDAKGLATHCSGAVFAELFLVAEKGFQSSFDRTRLEEGATLWALSAAGHYGVTVAELPENEAYFEIAVSKLEATELRKTQVGWCLANPPVR